MAKTARPKPTSTRIKMPAPVRPAVYLPSPHKAITERGDTIVVHTLTRKGVAASNLTLKPCPYCASKSVYVETGIAAYQFVRCGNEPCKANGPRANGVVEASKKWNGAKR